MPPPPDRHVLSARTSGASRRRAKCPDEWCLSPPHRVAELVRKASTHRYPSFDPMTEHIASEMRLILCSDKGKAGVLCRACLDLPSAACPYVSWCTAGVCSHAGLVDAARHDVLLVTVGGSLRSSLGRAGRVPDSTPGARMSAAAANSTAHNAIAVEAAMARLLQVDLGLTGG